VSLNVRTTIGVIANDAVSSPSGTVSERTNVVSVVERYAGQTGATDLAYRRDSTLAAEANVSLDPTNASLLDSFGRSYDFTTIAAFVFRNTGTVKIVLVFQISTMANAVNTQVEILPGATVAIQSPITSDGYDLSGGASIELTNPSTTTQAAYTMVLVGKGTRA
jgi:hypothetical protein